MPIYEDGEIRVRYEETGAEFPLLVIPGGGLNSGISFFDEKAPFDAPREFQDRYRCITLDLRNATAAVTGVGAMAQSSSRIFSAWW